MATPVEQSADRKTSINSTTVAKPTNLVNGNVIGIYAIYYDASVSSPTITGFTLRNSVTEATSNIVNAYYFDRVVDGTEGSSFTISGLSGGSNPDLIAMRLTGVATGGGFQLTASAHGVSANPSLPSITTVNANNLALMLHAGYNDRAADAGITNWTTLISDFDGVNDLYSRAIATATTTNTPSSYATFNGTSDAYITLIVVYSDTAIGGSVTGVGAMGFGFTLHGAGTRTTFDTASMGFGFTLHAAGTRTTSGVGNFGYGFHLTASGTNNKLGVGALTYGFTLAAAGIPNVLGVAHLSYGFNLTGTGIPNVLGVASLAYGYALAATGVPNVQGIGGFSYGYTLRGFGTRTGFGVGLFNYGFDLTGAGNVNGQVTGIGLFDFGFAMVAVGVVIPPAGNATLVFIPYNRRRHVR
jgi:hypothetical protein